MNSGKETHKGRSVAAKKAPPAQNQSNAVSEQARYTSPLSKKKRLKIPPELLETETPTPPVVPPAGPRVPTAPPPARPAPESKAAPLPSPPPPIPLPPETAGRLPEAYGTQRLLLAAPDPHSLYAHWDFTTRQLNQHEQQAADHHLVLRLYLKSLAGQLLNEIKLPAQTRSCFVPAPQTAARFVAELGYYNPDRSWVSLSISNPALTPPDAPSQETAISFGTFPVQIPYDQLLPALRAAIEQYPAAAREILQTYGRAPPLAGPHPAPPWTAEQDQALEPLSRIEQMRQAWFGSEQIPELLRGKGERAISSPSPSPPLPRAFWFNVHAELIVYGATEPDAQVTIDARAVELRPDGSFSIRIALPDGAYSIQFKATAADGRQQRTAQLQFLRRTDYQ